MEIKVVFLAHRVEFLELLREEADKYGVLVLEEPNDFLLEKFLNGSISLEEYVSNSDTSFPQYTLHQARLLKNLHNQGLKILQIEPYLEIIERIHVSIKVGKFSEYTRNPEVKNVLEVEREAVGKLIEYQEELMKGEFDRIVDKVVEFARKDSERFKLRDYMRASAIAELGEDDKVIVEAGYLHILLPIFLQRLNVRVETVNLLEKACRLLNLELNENPGDTLTKAYMLNIELNGYERLMAAQSLVYVSMISKDEKLPTKENPFPHLLEEINLARKVKKMSYEECKKEFFRILRKNNLRM